MLLAWEQKKMSLNDNEHVKGFYCFHILVHVQLEITWTG